MNILQTVVMVYIALWTILTSTTASVITKHRARMARSQSRIVAGVNVTPINKYPMMVAVVNQRGGTGWSGTILNKYYVLTHAGACAIIQQFGVDKYEIYAGLYHYGDPDPNYLQKHKIESVSYHEYAYNFSKGGFMDNFLGIIKVSSEFVWNDRVAPTNLPPPDWDVMPYQEFTGLAVGWGQGRRESYPYAPTRPLQEYQQQVVSSENCQQIIPDSRLTNQQLCLKGPTGGGPCWDDFGSPLFLYDEASEKHIQIGVTEEFNLGCEYDQDGYAIYAKVSKYVDWIANQIRTCDPTRRI